MTQPYPASAPVSQEPARLSPPRSVVRAIRFMYAGAASIVATLWDVADQSGAELMPAFYRAWRREHSRSAALRAAQLQLLARLRAGTVTIDTPGGPRTLPEHPFFWAGFVLVGEP